MKSLYKFVVLVVLVLAVSCVERDDAISMGRASFQAQSDLSFMIASEVVHESNDNLHQVIYTKDKKMYMVTNTEQTEYYSLVMNNIPELNSEIVAEIEHSGLDADFPNKKYVMTVIKAEQDKLWLWNEEGLMGFVLEY